jgi:hypothetical protein
MNAGTALVRAYLRLNGYLVLEEVPVVAPEPGGGFRTVTDLDLLAVRFPCARQGVPDGDGHIASPIRPDEALRAPTEAIDVVVGEVKEGRAHLNPTLRSPAVLRIAIGRVGICDPGETERAVEVLRHEGLVRLDGTTPARQIRLVAFGLGTSRVARTHHVVSLRDAAAFVRETVERAHEALLPATLSDPVLGLLHLANKLR